MNNFFVISFFLLLNRSLFNSLIDGSFKIVLQPKLALSTISIIGIDVQYICLSFRWVALNWCNDANALNMDFHTYSMVKVLRHL